MINVGFWGFNFVFQEDKDFYKRVYLALEGLFDVYDTEYNFLFRGVESNKGLPGSDFDRLCFNIINKLKRNYPYLSITTTATMGPTKTAEEQKQAKGKRPFDYYYIKSEEVGDAWTWISKKADYIICHYYSEIATSKERKAFHKIDKNKRISIASEDMTEKILQKISELPGRDKEIYQMILNGMRYSDIAEEYGVVPERISQIHRRLISKIKWSLIPVKVFVEK